MTDRRSLSRRQILWATVTAGAAASVGSGTAAMFQDQERFQSAVDAGELDLEIPTSSFDISGNSGSKGLTVSVSGNPAYVWFRTQCKQCTTVEEKLSVRFRVARDEDIQYLTGFDGTEDGYLSLRDARERLGGGVQLPGKFDPDSEVDLVVEWTTSGSTVSEELRTQFDFGFYAAQTRHVMNSSKVTLPWDDCEVDCSSSTSDVSGISWVAFCGSSDFKNNFTPVRSENNRKLRLDTSEYTISTKVRTIAVKYGQQIDVFNVDELNGNGWPDTVKVGTGTTYERAEGNNYVTPDGDSWSNNEFCNVSSGCKYDFPDPDGGEWECTGGVL
jgi:hypothetical protein